MDLVRACSPGLQPPSSQSPSSLPIYFFACMYYVPRKRTPGLPLLCDFLSLLHGPSGSGGCQDNETKLTQREQVILPFL